MNKKDETASRAVNRRVASLFEHWLSEGGRRRTQTELSKKSGISQPTISRIMTGDCHLGVYTLYKICKFFEIPADYILDAIDTSSHLKHRLKKLRIDEFMLQMNDHWSKEDYEKDKKLREEIKRLEKLVGEDGNADEERP